MKNFIYLFFAIVLFAVAAFVYWLVTPSGEEVATRSLVAPPSALMAFVQKWQPVLTLVSSLGGIVSFLFQLRVWRRSK